MQDLVDNSVEEVVLAEGTSDLDEWVAARLLLVPAATPVGTHLSGWREGNPPGTTVDLDPVDHSSI